MTSARCGRVLLLASCLWMLPLVACGDSPSHLVVSQFADVSPQPDHKSHLAPGATVNVTVSVRNIGSGPARAVIVTELLPKSFRYQALTTLGGNAIRTAIEDPAKSGNPGWGSWTIPGGSTSKESLLVLSFKVQAALQPGEYANRVRVATSSIGTLDEGVPLVFVVEPRPSLAVTAAATSGQVASGGTVSYALSIANTGSAVARNVSASISLPSGFLYLATTGLDGNSARVEYIDPPTNSLLPVWAAWDIPAAVSGTPGLLRITFQARVLPAVQPGMYTITTSVSGGQDLPMQTVGDAAPVSVSEATTIPISVVVKATAEYAPQNGNVGYVITLENNGLGAATNVVVTDTLPKDFSFAATNSITINGQGTASRLAPSPGTSTPQWGPFTIPAGGFGGSTLVIVLTARVAAGASLGAHPNVVSGSSSNAQITGGGDSNPVIVTVG